MARNRKKERAFPVGLFIILSLIVLIGGIFFIRGMAMRPVMTFVVAYRDPGGQVNDGIAVYYRGVQVGRVSKVELSENKDSTLVHVGLSEKGLKIPVNAEIYIKLEGITGQRYMEIKPPEKADRYVTYINEGEVVWGSNNATWEKIQEQLTRIAENRTIEKLLYKSELAVERLASAAGEFTQFGRRGHEFLEDMGPTTRDALNQFNRTAGGIEDAAVHFRQKTARLDDALDSLGTAGVKIGNTFDDFRMQLGTSNLIPNWSQAGSDISAGVRGLRSDVQMGIGSLTGDVTSIRNDVQQGIQGLTGPTSPVDFTQPAPGATPPQTAVPAESVRIDATTKTGTAPAKRTSLTVTAPAAGAVNAPAATGASVQSLDSLLVSLGSAGEVLERNVANYRSQTRDGQLERSLEELQTLARTIQQTANVGSGQTRINPQGSPEELQRQLVVLGDIGKQITNTTQHVAPQLISRAARRDGADAEQAQELLGTVQTLDTIGKSLTTRTAELQPKVSALINAQRNGGGGGGATGGIFGDLRVGIAEIRLAAERFNCVGKQLNGILSKRFLGFRLFFGSPGAGYDCDKIGEKR